MVGLNKDILHTLRMSPTNMWPENESGYQQIIAQDILCQEDDVAQIDELAYYFGPYRFPGTTPICYRKIYPEIFQDTTESAQETYQEWVHRSISSILRRMKAKDLLPFDVKLTEDFIVTIAQKIRRILTFETSAGIPLCEAIPQQIYEDIFIRMVSLLVKEEPLGEATHLYKEFNTICHRVSLALIDRIEKDGISASAMPNIPKIIQLAVLSGYVGINLKSSASAASTLLNRDFVPLKRDWLESLQTANAVSFDEINEVVEKLLTISKKPVGQFGIESIAQYREEVIESQIPTLLVFFCDDYMESIIDMKRFEVMLDTNRNLTVMFIPRNGRYGNDLALEDVANILHERQFNNLRKYLTLERFHVSPHGPKSGCIDLRCVSKKLINEIDILGKGKRIIFETKGCRNFEMLQGDLQFPWYIGFSCSRALSIRTVGIDGPPVFFRVPPGLKAYDGFTQPTIGPSPSYQTAQVRFAHMTTRQLHQALDSKLYQSMLSLSEGELELNKTLAQLSKNLNMTFAELITFLTGRSFTD